MEATEATDLGNEATKKTKKTNQFNVFVYSVGFGASFLRSVLFEFLRARQRL